MNSYSSTLKYLYGLQRRGMKFGLRNMRYVLKSAGNPERRFQCIHVAGTNGKGSTCAFLASMCMEGGYKTGLYTSPHLIRFTERIRINGREIPEKKLVYYAQALRPAIEHVQATFFEATTCIAFQFFADEEIDLAIIETGLGGRLDSTNVVVPLASVITNIGLDHTDVLGKTIRAIAREKGGIIKSGAPCITGSVDDQAIKTLQRIARTKRSPFVEARHVVRCTPTQSGVGIEFSSRPFTIRNAKVGLLGSHQEANAQLAVATLTVMKRALPGFGLRRNINNNAMRRGLERVVHNSGIHGRLQIVGRSHRYIMDVAHNGPGIRALVDALVSQSDVNLTVVFGVMKDKDYVTIVEELRRIASIIVAVAPRGERALSARELYRVIDKRGIPVALGGTVKAGLEIAKKHSVAKKPILITGSHYVVGEASQVLSRKKA